MRVSAAILAEYRRLLDELGSQAADRVSAAIAYTSGTRVAPVRDAAIEALSDAAAVEGDMAQALAAQLFDEICAAEGIDAEPGQLFADVIDEGWIAEKVHWHARALVKGNRSKFDGECRKLADFYVKRCAFENTVRNCDANRVRYARVPTGSETCPWCMMLASRGFVYSSEESASHGKHVGCDCIVLPGRGGTSHMDATQIAGYDPAEWRARWQEAREGKRGRTPGAKARESVGAMRYRTNRSSKVILNKTRFGHKLSKHCRDWGLDPSSADDRQRFYEIASDIIDNADEITVGSNWRNQPQPCTYYRKGDDLVLVNGDDEFVTMMRGGATNKRFLATREGVQGV